MRPPRIDRTAAISVQAWTAGWQPFVGEGIQSERRNVLLMRLEPDRVAFFIGDDSAFTPSQHDGTGSQRPVMDDESAWQPLQPGPLGIAGGRFQDLPAGIIGLFGKFSRLPGGKAFRQFFGSKFSQGRSQWDLRLLVSFPGELRVGRRGVDCFRSVNGLCKRRGECVVIFLWKWIVFVVVATNTTEGQAEHGSTDGHQHVVELIIADPFNGFGGDLSGVWSGHQKTAGRGGVIFVRLQLVSRQLHPDKLVIGEVLIECSNDPVAIVIGTGAKAVELVPPAFGEASHIQPVTGPLFPILGTCEQFIDDGLECLRGRVFQEAFDLLRCGGEANQIEIGTADQFFF